MSDEGASPRELLLEGCRRNNTALLTELFERLGSPEKIARLCNESRDGVGGFALHLAAGYGSYEVLDLLLDQEGLEVDPIDRLESDTPLHKAIRCVNGLQPAEWEAGAGCVELLLDAGADPRIRNKARLLPRELVDPRNKNLRNLLHKAEFAIVAGDDVVNGDGDEGGEGSASDSE